MKIIETQTTAKDKYVQIYVNKEEYKNIYLNNEIEKYNKNNYKVAIFISGNKKYLPIIKKIIDTEIEKQNETRYTTINMRNKPNGISQGEEL